MDQPSLLIVDDEPDNFDVIEALLSVGQNTPGETQAYQLHYAVNGQSAINSLDLFQPDIILLDVMMPGMNGMEVCQRIKAMPQGKAIPIIMVTALSAQEDLARCFQAGADDFISKPINGLELRARVRSMVRIKQQYDDLQALLKLREDMVNMLVHDLRNPLTNILFGLSTLEIQDCVSDRQKNRITQMRLSGKHLQSLIDDLLLMAKIESSKLQLNPTEIDLCNFITSVLSEFKGIAAQKKIELVSQLPEPGGSISVDVALFSRVLDNLVSNAIKFSPKQSKVVVSASYLASGGGRIQISDLGAGIPDALRQKIFEKYEIGTLMQDVSQIGLGLAFCKMVVEAHNGEISVSSNYPTGSIFEISLPPSCDL
jgi:two-component system, sensor histidine kinase and response regulator